MIYLLILHHSFLFSKIGVKVVIIFRIVMEIKRVNHFQQCLEPIKYSINVIYYLKPIWIQPLLPSAISQICCQPGSQSKHRYHQRYSPYTSFHCLAPTCPSPLSTAVNSSGKSSWGLRAFSLQFSSLCECAFLTVWSWLRSVLCLER